MNEKSRPFLALHTVLARDMIPRIISSHITELKSGEELHRTEMFNNLRNGIQNRLNDSVLDKVIRNAASSWTQAGFLDGRMRKIRRTVEPTVVAVCHALLLGYFLGYRCETLFNTFWIRLYDLPKTTIIEMALDAKRMGFLEMSQSGGVVSISFNTILTEQERRLINGTN